MAQGNSERHEAELFLQNPPEFVFNKNLFRQLVSEHDAVAHRAPHEPVVEFNTEPSCRRILGTFDETTRLITIHVLEVARAAMINQNASDLRQIFHRELVKVLAHEGGHWQLHKRYGFLLLFERIALRTTLALTGYALLGLLWVSLAGLLYYAVGAQENPFMKITAGFGASLLGFATFVLSIQGFSFMRHFASYATYCLCYTERYARRCEKKTDHDPRWKRVVELKD